MLFVKHSMCNDVLEVNKYQEAAGVKPLPIRRIDNAIEGKCVQSFWKPAPEELAALNAGHPVSLIVHGGTHPPLLIGVATVRE